MTSEKYDFQQLVRQIKDIHENLLKQATKAVNVGLTFRNWLIGHYIHRYEQNGEDRANYGEHLLNNLSQNLQKHGLKRISERELRRYRLFYLSYPQIREVLTPGLCSNIETTQLVTSSTVIRETVSPGLQMPAEKLVERLSFKEVMSESDLEDALLDKIQE